LPPGIEIKDVGDIFNFRYLVNWKEDDPTDFFDVSWIPIE
jgi:hypothetical protein